MQINSDHPTAVAPPPTKCVNCGSEERRLLHHVRHRGVFRRLCTNCVLRFNTQSFCPTCFQVYPPNPPNDSMVLCAKCYSTSHSICVPSHPTPYHCPMCVNPSAPLFQLKPPGEDNVDISSSEEWRVMDRDAARKLLAAAKIAAYTMTKAAASAKADAERKAREAANARKRAREALERVRELVDKERARKMEEAARRAINGGFVYTVNGNGGVGSNGAGPSSVAGNSNHVMMNGGNQMGAAGHMEFGGNVDDEDDDDDVMMMDMDMDVDVDIDVDVDDSGVGMNDHGVAAVGEDDAENGMVMPEDIRAGRLENGEEPRANGMH